MGYKNKNQKRHSKPNRKPQKKQEEDFEDFDDPTEDDQLFFDEEFVPPVDEDLDEPEDFELHKIYKNKKQEDEEDFGEDEMDGEEFGDEAFAEDDEEDLEEADEHEEPEIEIRSITIDEEKLNKVIGQVNTGSKHALKIILKIFRGAITQGTEDADSQPAHGSRLIEYEVLDGSVYNKVVSFTLTAVPKLLLKESKIKAAEEGISKPAMIMNNIFFANLMKLFQKTFDKNILIYLLSCTANFTKLFLLSKNYGVKFLNKMIELWSTHESNIVKFKAFINMRALCSEQKTPEKLEKLLRKIYLAFVKNAKHVNWLNYEQITFMINCYVLTSEFLNKQVELLGLNKESAYVVGFTYMREIAVHLKNCMKERTKENIFKIYNWQFLNCLRLWFAAVGTYPSKEDLGRLSHPLIEIAFGILKFYPNVRYAPFRIHLLDYVNEFSFKSSVYTPVTTYLLDMLKEINFDKKRDRSISKNFDFIINVKVQKTFLKAEHFYGQLFKLIIDKLTQAFSNLTAFISFPELLAVSRLWLKKHLRNLKNKELKVYCKKLFEQLDESQKVIEENRKNIEFPKDLKEFKGDTRNLLQSRFIICCLIFKKCSKVQRQTRSQKN